MKLGFTGSREGMSEKQKHLFLEYILHHQIEEFHHGDCVGSDKEAFLIMKKNKTCKIIGHPPIKNNLRAYCASDYIMTPKDYLTRDRDIVDMCDIIIGTPKDNFGKGGTWYTLDYAISNKKQVLIIHRTGDILTFNENK